MYLNDITSISVQNISDRMPSTASAMTALESLCGVPAIARQLASFWASRPALLPVDVGMDELPLASATGQRPRDRAFF